MSEILIRPATHADVAAIRDVLVATWHATYDAIYGRARVSAITSDWHALDAIARLVGFGPASLMVAEENGRVLATATATEPSPGAAKLDRLYVLPAAQGRGIGAALMHATLARLPSATTVSLEVEPQNISAVAFYKRHGFAFKHRVSDCARAGSGIPADVYERALPL